MLEQNVYTVGTATTTVVAPTVDAAHYVVKNLEPSEDAGALARAGHMYQVNAYRSIANNGTATFGFLTGAQGAQIEFWNFNSSDSSILGSLIEGATVPAGTAVTAYNVNRNETDVYDASIKAVASATGGTIVATEYIGASNQATGGAATSMPITLKPSTQYAFRFVDVGGNGTDFHASIGWAEDYNGYNEIWLGTVNETYVLRGGEELSMYLRPYGTINATALRDGCRLAVMRQE